MTTWSHGLLNLLICVGLLAVMPLGLRLIAAPGVPSVRRLWFLAATPAAVSVWLPRGWLAATLAALYLPATTALLLSASRLPLPRRLFTRRGATTTAAGGLGRGARDVAVATAFVAPTVGASALVAERVGYKLFGFGLDVLALTVAHFHYAGFAAALIAGLVSQVDGGRRASRLAAVSVPVGVGVVFVGFFTSEWVELAGAVVLTFGMWLVGWLTWRVARELGGEAVGGSDPGPVGAHRGPAGHPEGDPDRRGLATRQGDSPDQRGTTGTGPAPHTPAPDQLGLAARGDGPVSRRGARRGERGDAVTRGLFVVSAATLVATMVLALSWAFGRAAGVPHLPVSWMVATHGVANALGFALCGLVAWRRMGWRRTARSSEWH